MMSSKQVMTGALAAWLTGVLAVFGEDDGPSNAYHRVLEGTVGKGLEVRMVLERRGEQLDGFYFYKSHRKLLSLAGKESDWDGGIEMMEAPGHIGGTEGEDTGKWTGKFNDDGALVGTWSSSDGKKKLPFKLQEVKSPMVLKVRPVNRSLNCVYVHDDYQGGLTWDLSYVRFSPERDGVGTINQWVRSQVQASLMDDVEDGAEKTKVIAGATDDRIEKSLRGMAGEDALEMAGFAPESHKLKVLVVHNADGILCLGMDHWAYEGGAHGNGHSEYVVFDVSTGKRLQLEQVLKAGYEKPLAKIGGRILLEQAGAGPGAPLSEAGLFEDTLELNQNWFVTVEGIGFSYSPYETASFARGFVVFTVPFAELKPWLKEGTLVSRMMPPE